MPTAMATTFLNAEAVSAPATSLVVRVNMDGALRVRAASRRASGSREANNSAVGDPTTISAAIPGPASVTTGAASPRTFAATWDGVSRVSGSQPLVARTQTVPGRVCGAAAAITGCRPELDTATNTMSTPDRTAGHSSRRKTTMSGWNVTPIAGCGRCSRQARTTAVSYSVASTATGWPIRARWVARAVPIAPAPRTAIIFHRLKETDDPPPRAAPYRSAQSNLTATGRLRQGMKSR